MIGQRFTRLVVLSLHAKGQKMPRKIATWLCRCDCGQTTLATAINLKTGNTKSCGCLRRTQRLTHGQSTGKNKTGAYESWSAMIDRCHNPNCRGYKNYGGRGIAVCDAWRKFENFFADMGPRPPGFSIERADNDRGYDPANCSWIPRADQVKNQRFRGWRNRINA